MVWRLAPRPSPYVGSRPLRWRYQDQHPAHFHYRFQREERHRIGLKDCRSQVFRNHQGKERRCHQDNRCDQDQFCKSCWKDFHFFKVRYDFGLQGSEDIHFFIQRQVFFSRKHLR